MNELELLMALETSSRQTGRTTALAKACDEIGGVFVVGTEAQKRIVKSKFPTLDVRILSERNLIGINKTVIFDHLTWLHALSKSGTEVMKTRAEINSYRRELLKLKRIINEMEFLK